MLVTLQAMSTLLYAEKFENATITGYFEFVFEKTQAGNEMIFVISTISESSVFKMFSDHIKIQSRRFQIPVV